MAFDDEQTTNGEAEMPDPEVSNLSRQSFARTGSSNDPGVDVLSELAARGHEAVNRVLDDLATDPRLTEAIDSLLAVKERLTETARGARAQLDQGADESVSELRDRVDALERRLRDLEGTAGPSHVDPSVADSSEDSPS